MLYDLSIQQVLWDDEYWFAWSPPCPRAWKLVPDPIRFKDGIIIMLEFIRGEQWYVSIGAVLDARDQLVRVSLIMATDDKVDHDFVDRVKTNPYPLVPVDSRQFFQGGQMRFFFLTKDQSSSNWHSSR